MHGAAMCADVAHAVVVFRNKSGQLRPALTAVGLRSWGGEVKRGGWWLYHAVDFTEFKMPVDEQYTRVCHAVLRR